MNGALIRAFLGLSGALLAVTGLTVLLDPLSVLGIEIGAPGGEASLLSELRSPGLLLVASAVLSFVGAVRRRIAGTALILSALLYGSFGISRLLSLVIDGTPSTSILAAMMIELVAGVFAIAALAALKKAGSGRSGRLVAIDIAGEAS